MRSFISTLSMANAIILYPKDPFPQQHQYFAMFTCDGVLCDTIVQAQRLMAAGMSETS
jgi:hypothetical protein